MKKHSYLIIAFATILSWSFGQTPKSSIDSLPSKKIMFTSSLVYHDKKSSLPDKIDVQGTITDISRGNCGVYCSGGVIKVKLDKKIKNYKDAYVYLVTACLSEDVEVNTKVDVSGTKYKRTDKECYYLNVDNTIDSKGTPFYKLSEEQTAKIK